MVTDFQATPIKERSPGRAYFWAGIGVCLLGMVLVIIQYSLKQLIVPWYAAVLGTLGAILLLYSVVRRRSVSRIVALVLIVAVVGFEWLMLLSLSKLPAYEGPARAGRQIPAFQTTLADGSPFTEKSLQDGIPNVMVFFRGRW